MLDLIYVVAIPLGAFGGAALMLCLTHARDIAFLMLFAVLHGLGLTKLEDVRDFLKAFAIKATETSK